MHQRYRNNPINCQQEKEHPHINGDIIQFYPHPCITRNILEKNPSRDRYHYWNNPVYKKQKAIYFVK